MPRASVDILDSIELIASTKDRKASLHPGLCKSPLSSLGFRSLIHYWTVFRDVNHDDTECQPSNKTTSGIRRLVSMSRATLLVCSTFSIWGSGTHCYRTVAESSPSVPRQPTIKTTSGIRRFGAGRLFYILIFLVWVLITLTAYAMDSFWSTQNYSRVHTSWFHKRSTSIWDHQRDNPINRYVIMFHPFKNDSDRICVRNAILLLEVHTNRPTSGISRFESTSTQSPSICTSIFFLCL